MSLRSIRGLCAALVVVAAGAASVQAAGSAVLIQKQVGFAATLSTQQKAGLGYSKLDRTLINVAEAAKTAPKTSMVASLKSAAPAARLSLKVPSAVPTVLADITVRKGSGPQVETQLRQLGVTKLSTFSNLISAWIPANRLTDAAAIGAVHSMRAPQVRTNTGAVESQGDFIQKSFALRASTLLPGLTGAGVTVGVLSDSFGCTSDIKSYADDVASGDLPANLEVIDEISDCTGATDEGRAMAQIVYDVAPGATLKFASAFNGEAEFANNIVALAAAGAKVIVDDVSYFDEPFYQDGIISQAVDQVRALGVAYYSSAGNNARDSYEAPFADSGVVGPAGGTIAGEKLMNFDTTGATKSPILPITVPANSSILVYLQWDDPYATGGGDNGGAVNLLDFCLTGPPSGGVTDDNILFCTGPVAAGSDPFQIFGGTIDTSDFSGGLLVGLADGSAPAHIKIAYSGLSVDQFATNSGTVQGHPAAKGAAAVGASYFRANNICLPLIYPQFALEDFSSAGGTPILFDVDGTPLTTPEIRQKPEFVAPDGGLTTFFIQQIGARTSVETKCNNPADGYNFFGTSAAAPHAAGVAAVLLEAAPNANPDEIKAALQKSALTPINRILSGSGSTADPYVYDNQPTPNFDVGYGFVQADAALPALLPAATLSSSAFSFSLTAALQGNATQTLTVTNSGGSTLTLSAPQVAGPFTVSNGCGDTLAPGDSCTLIIGFAPTQTGTFTGMVSIISDALSSPDTVMLSGTKLAEDNGDGGGSFGLLGLLPLLAAGLRRRSLRLRK